jgi:hypothetical protein
MARRNPAKNWVFTDFYAPHHNGTLADHRAFVPALVTDNPHISPHYIDNLERLEGADRARLLLGDWNYDDDPAALMSRDAIMDLFTNDHVPKGAKALTCDVARYGSDKTVIMLWDGMRVEHVYTYQGQATNETASAILSTARLEGVPRSRIVIDDDGIGGGVVDLIRGCVPFKGGAKPYKGENYANYKAQCCYLLAQVVNERAMFIASTEHRETLAEELAWVKRHKIDSDGKLSILPKEKVKEGLGRSPDYGDNLMMRMALELTPSMAIFERSIERENRRTVDGIRKDMRDELESRYNR